MLVLFTQKFVIKLSKIWVWDPGSEIRDLSVSNKVGTVFIYKNIKKIIIRGKKEHVPGPTSCEKRTFSLSLMYWERRGDTSSPNRDWLSRHR
jgi:hypothetical protein